MRLEKLEYSQYEGEPNEWRLSPTDFIDVTLIVGKNASGKTRLLNVIGGFAKILSGRSDELFNSGTFKATFKSGSTYQYELTLKGKEVQHESLDIDGKNMFRRNPDGSGEIYASAIPEPSKIAFKVPNNSVVAFTKRDGIQHPWLELLHGWASSVVTYHFGTEPGKRTAVVVAKTDGGRKKPDHLDESKVLELFLAGTEKFNDKFVKAVIADMESLGYDVEDIILSETPSIQAIAPMPGPLQTLHIKEKGVDGYIRQNELSAGMYSALALIIHLTYNEMAGLKSVLLIDDIGEGLDFERSSSLISLVFEKAKSHFLQTIMTTNDRYVMNSIPLENWSVMYRQGSHVQLITPRTSAKIFERFKSIGLSNFDFFARELFLEEN